jgi:hypothetical protein
MLIIGVLPTFVSCITIATTTDIILQTVEIGKDILPCHLCKAIVVAQIERGKER